MRSRATGARPGARPRSWLIRASGPTQGGGPASPGQIRAGAQELAGKPAELRRAGRAGGGAQRSWCLKSPRPPGSAVHKGRGPRAPFRGSSGRGPGSDPSLSPPGRKTAQTLTLEGHQVGFQRDAGLTRGFGSFSSALFGVLVRSDFPGQPEPSNTRLLNGGVYCAGRVALGSQSAQQLGGVFD